MTILWFGGARFLRDKFSNGKYLIMISIILTWPSSDLSPNARLHWSQVAKAKKKYRMDCCLQSKIQGARPIQAERIDAVFTFYPPSKRRIDLDNCIARMKSGIDGIADAIRVDDSKWRMTFEIAEPCKGGMVKVGISCDTHHA